MRFSWNEDTFRWFEDASAYTEYDKKLAHLLLPYLNGCKTVCDIGCGMALVDFELAPFINSITCVDYDVNVVQNILKRIKATDTDNIQTICSDGIGLAGNDAYDAVMAIFHGDVERIGLPYLSYAKRRLILVVHADAYGTTGPQNYRVRKCCDIGSTRTWLKSQGLKYQFQEAELEFGQPHRSLEDAIAYTKVFTKGAPDEELEAYVKEHLTETGREDFPFYTLKTRKFGIFAVEKPR